MQINSVSNIQFRGLGSVFKKSNAATEIKSETPKTDSLEKDLDKMETLGRSMVKKINSLPCQMDFAIRKAAARELLPNSKKILAEFALAFRYGNRPDAKLDEDVINNLKKYFEAEGKEFNEKDIKIMAAGNSDEDRLVYNIPLYYDEETGLTTVFTKDGTPNYKVSYETGFGGKLTDVTITEVYHSKNQEWMVR